MMNAKDKKLIASLADLVAELLQAAQDNPKQARKYNIARGKIELAMRWIGDGERRPLVRPESILPQYEKKPREETRILEPPAGDILADNLQKEEPRPKRKRNAKTGADLGFDDAL